MENLLIIEDEKDIRDSLQDILEMAGYNVEVAKDGKLGFDAILSSKPDLVICDVNMPELDGFELLGAINQRLHDQVIPPFIFLTAKVEKQDIRHGMSLGADDYILKPFEHNELLEIVRLRLSKRKMLLENGTPVGPVQGSADSLEKLAIPSDEGLELVPFENIIRCEADRAYCNFYLNSGKKILVSKSMKEFENILIKKGFIKIHKSTIINVKYVDKYIRGKGGMLQMSDGTVVAVAVRKKEELMKLINPKIN
ncbi:MAG: response regulator [Flavobacteriales bacterium]|nr:response regulator [Flavobacteriales bacterium]